MKEVPGRRPLRLLQRSGRWARVAGVLTAVVAAGLAVLAASLGWGTQPMPIGIGVTPSPSASGPPRLADIAWWDAGNIGFGFVRPPEPNDPVQPASFRQVRIGTLDGRITRQMAAPWAGGFVSGPFGPDVLIGEELAGGTRILRVSALDGSAAEILDTDAVVRAAVLSPDGASLYYVPLARDSLIDRGLWRRDLVGGVDTQLLGGQLAATPRADTEPDLVDWWMLITPDGRRLVVQGCFGEVSCITHIVDLASGNDAAVDTLSWPRGITNEYLLARAKPDDGSLVALDLDTLEGARVMRDHAEAVALVLNGRTHVASAGMDGMGVLTVLPVDEPNAWWIVAGDRGSNDPRVRFERIVEAHGVSLPPGWVMRWPSSFAIFAGKPPDEAGAGELVNVTTGERIPLAPMTLAAERSDCAVDLPSQMPSGRPPGMAVETLIDGVRYLRFGSGEDQLLLAIGVPVLGTVADLKAEPAVRVRDNEARLVTPMDQRGDVALVWEQDGCTYTAWLPEGASIEDAVEYASRY